MILNDHSNEVINPKSDAMYNLVARLRAKGAPVNGIGMQMRLYAPYIPTKADVIANMRRFKIDLGMRVYVTGFGVDIREIQGTEEERFAYQAQVYRDMLEACNESDACSSFAVFGMSDPSKLFDNRNSDPLMFDDYDPTPAYFAVQEALASLPER